MNAEERRIWSWKQALGLSCGAFTGAWYEESARAAEAPSVAVWDRGGHLPWVKISETPCPGGPWTSEPDRWNGSWTCQRKHFHPSEAARPGSRHADLDRAVAS